MNQRRVITFNDPRTTTAFDMTTMSYSARRPSEVGRDGHYYRGYRRSRGPAGTEVWVRR